MTIQLFRPQVTTLRGPFYHPKKIYIPTIIQPCIYHQYYHAPRIFISLLFEPMDPSKKAGSRYNKVNQQKKFYLLTLIYRQHLPVREAAQIVGINYLTAKTIVFFYKNNHKTYQFDLNNPHLPSRGSNCPTASVVTLRKLNSIQEKLNYPKSRIQVICSIGNILSPSTATSEREGPPEKEANSGVALLETLPNNLAVPPASRANMIWPYPSLFETGQQRKDGFDGKLGFVDGEADRTRASC